MQPEQPEIPGLPADAIVETSSLLRNNCVCTNVEKHYSPPPPPPPMLIDRSMPPFGFAVRIGSTPERRVIASTVLDPSDDSDATIITASPVFRSSSVPVGNRSIICERSAPAERCAPP